MTEQRRPDAATPESPVRRALSRPEQEPLARLLDDGFQEELVPALWRRVAQRSARRSDGWSAKIALLAAALALACGAWLLLRRAAPGPLNQADGRAPRVLEAGERPLATPFSDGSRVDLSSGGRLEVLRNDERSFVVALRRGAGVFDVKPGGPRRWVIEAGLASVEVVGTHFEVDRTPELVRVSVERGIVVVRGEKVPNGVVQLTAGTRIELRGDPAPEASASPEVNAAQDASAQPGGIAALAQPAANPLSPMAAPVSASSSSSPVSALAAATGAARAGDEIDALLANADAARRRSDDASAIAALEAVLRRASERDPRRSLAALSLARLTAHGDPARAANALDEPAMQAMPEGLAEDALARRVDAEGEAGHSERAAALAAEYQRRFPRGRHLEDVRRWLGP